MPRPRITRTRSLRALQVAAGAVRVDRVAGQALEQPLHRRSI